MRHYRATTLRVGVFGFLLNVVVAAALVGQDPRDALVARAFNEFDAARRQQLLMSALNPMAGPPRGAWPVGVQLLAQTLIEDGKDSVAAAWLRWAIRLSPDLQPDTVQFLPRVVAAYRAAHAFVSQTRSPADSAAVPAWLWPTQGAADSVGRLQVAGPSAMPMRVEVKSVGPIGLGSTIPLSPGSYHIIASAQGYDSIRVTREVVPGVTTVLEFHFRSAAAVARVTPKRPAEEVTHPTGAQPQTKKGFPWVWVAVGGAGAVALAVLLSGKPPQPPPRTYGGIIITFPSP